MVLNTPGSFICLKYLRGFPLVCIHKNGIVSILDVPFKVVNSLHSLLLSQITRCLSQDLY